MTWRSGGTSLHISEKLLGMSFLAPNNFSFFGELSHHGRLLLKVLIVIYFHTVAVHFELGLQPELFVDFRRGGGLEAFER